MSNGLSKWLDLNKVLKDASSGANTKWDTLIKAKDIKKLNYEFQLPAFTFNNIISYEVPVVFHQYNFIAPENFTILNWLDIRNALNLSTVDTRFYIVIRYRDGGKLVRYRISDSGSAQLSMPYYTGQLIESDFVLEVWSLSGNEEIQKDYINPSDITFVTSIMYDPQSDSETGSLIVPTSEALGHKFGSNGDLFNSYPSPNPAVFSPLGPFNSNS